MQQNLGRIIDNHLLPPEPSPLLCKSCKNEVDDDAARVGDNYYCDECFITLADRAFCVLINSFAGNRPGLELLQEAKYIVGELLERV